MHKRLLDEIYATMEEVNKLILDGCGLYKNDLRIFSSIIIPLRLGTNLDPLVIQMMTMNLVMAEDLLHYLKMNMNSFSVMMFWVPRGFKALLPIVIFPI